MGQTNSLKFKTNQQGTFGDAYQKGILLAFLKIEHAKMLRAFITCQDGHFETHENG
jgi:hypothetical protein